jgi:hypothetical protein
MGNVDEFKRLHLEYSAASLACVGGPYDEHGVLCQKALDAEQALIEWAEKREAKAATDLHEMTMKFLTLRAFVVHHFEEDCGICVHTWCPYHEEGAKDFCAAPTLESKVRENCHRT